jgi:hypothetical protein
MVDLCDIRGHEKAFDGSYLIFNSEYFSDGLEGAYLFDSKCPGFDITPVGGTNDQWGKINDIVYGVGTVGTMDKKIRAKFSGIYHAEGKRSTFSVMAIDNVIYQMKN